MANRFDVGTPQKYVSIYPFQELAAIGEKLNARAGQAQQKMSAIEDAISKMEVEDQVITEGSTLGDQYTPGVQWASTGYGQFKNNLLNTVKTAHEDLTALWQAGEISISDLERQSNILNKNILKDYNKLSLAAENSKVIKEINKKYRENQDVPNSPFVLNTLAKAGSEFLKDPFALNYVGAPIAKLLTEMDYVNKYASGFKDSDIAQFQTAADKNGYIDYGKITGVTADRVKAVAQDVDTDPEIGSQLKQQAYRDVANMMDPNNSNFNVAVQKQYEGYKNQFIQSVLAKAVGQTTTHNLKFDRLGETKKLQDEMNALQVSGLIPGDPQTINMDSAFKDITSYNDKTKSHVLNRDPYIVMPEGSRQSGNIFLNERADVSFFKNKEINQQNEKIKKQLADIAIQLNQKAPTNKQEAEKLLNAYLEETKYIQGQPVMDPKEQKVISEQFKNNPEKFSIYEDGYGKEAVAALTPEERKTFNALTPVSFKLNNGTFMTVYKGSYTDKNGALKQIYLRDIDDTKNSYVDIYANIRNNAMNIYQSNFKTKLENTNSEEYKKLNALNYSSQGEKIKKIISGAYADQTKSLLKPDAFIINDMQQDRQGNIYYTIVKTKDDSKLDQKNIKIPDTEQIVFKIVNTEQGPTMYLVGNISQDLYNSVTNSYIKTKAGQSNFPQKKLTEYVNFNDND
jgi:hypothetical protein